MFDHGTQRYRVRLRHRWHEAVRQLYYQCAARGWIENNEREYQKIIGLLTDAREAGLFDWDAIEDRGCEVVMRPCWRSPAEILKAAASSYHEDRWELHDVRVVVVLEKAAGSWTPCAHGRRQSAIRM